ncbi:hypothetical protein EMPG_11726 [Blastomyces silverae]|uniref:Uncharacterized protein n=1 Tax=Blastomyces silverae TaxID=2060906 RepID=A0A0H1BPX3_9EURO|nr:hypothetical protein EMPG_11726 [Blastomyces silverae]
MDESDTRELLCLILMDTTESLLRAPVPVIEYQVRDPYIVNQHAGLCGPLLPLLYRVPNISQAVLNRFSDVEMLLLTSQANLRRTAALLIFHRLRYPFGERDAEADLLAESIATDMAHCLEMAGFYPPNITLVLLVAGTEIHDAAGRQHILSLVSGIRGATFYPFVTNLRRLLARAWADRDRGIASYLFRISEDHPELSISL